MIHHVKVLDPDGIPHSGSKDGVAEKGDVIETSRIAGMALVESGRAKWTMSKAKNPPKASSKKKDGKSKSKEEVAEENAELAEKADSELADGLDLGLAKAEVKEALESSNFNTMRSTLAKVWTGPTNGLKKPEVEATLRHLLTLL